MMNPQPPYGRGGEEMLRPAGRRGGC